MSTSSLRNRLRRLKRGPEATHGLEDFVPDLTRVSIPDGDHWVLHQHPDRIATIMRDWLP